MCLSRVGGRGLGSGCRCSGSGDSLALAGQDRRPHDGRQPALVSPFLQVRPSPPPPDCVEPRSPAAPVAGVRASALGGRAGGPRGRRGPPGTFQTAAGTQRRAGGSPIRWPGGGAPAPPSAQRQGGVWRPSATVTPWPVAPHAHTWRRWPHRREQGDRRWKPFCYVSLWRPWRLTVGLMRAHLSRGPRGQEGPGGSLEHAPWQ